MSPTVDYESWLAKQKQDPEFLAALEKLEPGYQVARLRIQQGLSQAELADRVGTKQSSIARLENGDHLPSLSFLEKVASALGANVKVQLIPNQLVHAIRDESADYKTKP